MNLLLDEQAYFDRFEFDRPGYVELSGPNRKIRHILLHSVKAAGKLALVEELDDSVITDEVVPDLAIYRSQLVNTLELDTEPIESFELRQTEPGEAEGLRDLFVKICQTHLSIANYRLAEFVEQQEHGLTVSKNLAQVSAELLHRVAATLALVYEVNLPLAHRTRMEQLLGKPIPNL